MATGIQLHRWIHLRVHMCFCTGLETSQAALAYCTHQSVETRVPPLCASRLFCPAGAAKRLSLSCRSKFSQTVREVAHTFTSATAVCSSETRRHLVGQMTGQCTSYVYEILFVDILIDEACLCIGC